MKLSHLLLIALLSTGFAGATSTGYIEAKQLFTDKSYDLAYDKASKLSASGDVDAINLVGLMYLYGFGVASNDESAIKMFNKAGAQGSKDAKINLKDIQSLYEKLLIKYQEEGRYKYSQQKLVSWLSTIDSKYKDKMLSNNGELFTLPMPGKFVNAYPYNKGDHPELPPKRKSFNTISYTLKDDLKKHILGGEAEFLYLSVLVWRNVTGLESVPMLKKDAKAVIKKLLKPLIEDFTGDLIEAKNLSFELIIDEDNAFGYFITVDGFEIAITRFTLKEKIFTMVLANGNPNISKPVKEDMIEWVNLILEANK